MSTKRSNWISPRVDCWFKRFIFHNHNLSSSSSHVTVCHMAGEWVMIVRLSLCHTELQHLLQTIKRVKNDSLPDFYLLNALSHALGLVSDSVRVCVCVCFMVTSVSSSAVTWLLWAVCRVCCEWWCLCCESKNVSSGHIFLWNVSAGSYLPSSNNLPMFVR